LLAAELGVRHLLSAKQGFNGKNMSRVKIKTQSLPKRCEICHKADCFELDTLLCKRCSGLQLVIDKDVNTVDGEEKEHREIFKKLDGSKNYGWKGQSKQVSKSNLIACSLMFVNLSYFITVLNLLNSNAMLSFYNIITLTGSLLLFEVLVLILFFRKNVVVYKGVKLGLIFTLFVIVVLFVIFLLPLQRPRSPL
jgi:hypothetical protein